MGVGVEPGRGRGDLRGRRRSRPQGRRRRPGRAGGSHGDGLGDVVTGNPGLHWWREADGTWPAVPAGPTPSTTSPPATSTATGWAICWSSGAGGPTCGPGRAASRSRPGTSLPVWGNVADMDVATVRSTWSSSTPGTRTAWAAPPGRDPDRAPDRRRDHRAGRSGRRRRRGPGRTGWFWGTGWLESDGTGSAGRPARSRPRSGTAT